MITVIDSGIGNTASVVNMIRHLGGEARLTASLPDVASADKLVLSGVGAFDAGMRALQEADLDTAILRAVTDRGATILGICLGMQLLLDASEEGSLAGLGLIRGKLRLFEPGDRRLRVPHMGWNIVTPVRPSALFDATGDELRFYFVHSYFAECDEPGDVAATTTYGHEFTSAVARDNILGVQFHPEKSHRFGMALFRRFLAL